MTVTNIEHEKTFFLYISSDISGNQNINRYGSVELLSLMQEISVHEYIIRLQLTSILVHKMCAVTDKSVFDNKRHTV